MKRFIVYAGANGAGKSSLRAGGSDAVDIEIDPDRIARTINPDDPRSVDLTAGKEALRQFDQTLSEGKSLSLETTLTGRGILTRMRAAKTAGYEVELRYVGVKDADLNVERVNARASQGGHWISETDVRRRAVSSLENLPAAIAIADRSLLLDNTGSTHRQVLAVERGRVVFQSPDVPPWLAGQMSRIEAIVGATSPSAAKSAVSHIDPFGDRATRGHLRNRIGTADPAEIARIEAKTFAANILPALETLEASRTITYRDVLAVHQRLFSTVYSWAGQDRAALLSETPGSRISSLFAAPGDAQLNMETGLVMGLDPAIMRSRPGEVFGRLAQAHPFLEGNGRTLMAVHADLARRADINIDWSQISKPTFMSALVQELKASGSAMDTLIRPHVQAGALPTAQAAEALTTLFAGRQSGPSPSI